MKAVIGPAEQFAQAVLEKSSLGVVLAILQIEWMTQRHYLDGVRDDRGIDPQFASLLKHHWMEEAQHAKLDTLIAEALAERASEAEIAQGLEDYLAIGGMIDEGLQQQVEFDITALERASGRTFNDAEKQQLRQVQQAAYRYTFLTSGMTHPNFVGTLQQISPLGAAQVADLVQVPS